MREKHHHSVSFPVVFGSYLFVIFLSAQLNEALATTMVSNLDNPPDGTWSVYDHDNFGNRMGRDVAGSFTTGSNSVTLQSITLLFGNSSANPGGFSLSLYTDSSFLPGTNLGVTFTGNTAPNDALYTYTPVGEFILDSSTTYWVVASVTHTAPDKAYAWRTSTDLSENGSPGWSMGNTALREFNNGVPGIWTADDNNAPLFSVQAGVSSVPEPSSVVMLVVGAGGLFGYGYRRKRRLAA